MVQALVKVRRALISVFDKSGVKELASGLYEANPDVTILSSGGTYRELVPHSKEKGYRLVEVSAYTEYPESPGGRLKTLHPRVHGGNLLNTDDPEHAEYMRKHGILETDLLVNNLYPFKKKVDEGADIGEIIENIDIGGPAMIRSAAKNFRRVAVVVEPEQYDELLEELRYTNGHTLLLTRVRLAGRAFEETRDYDASIHDFFQGRTPEEIRDYYLRGQRESA